MLKLESKLILYNALTKGFIILILGTIMLVFIDSISNQQLDVRLEDKAKIFINNFSEKDLSKELKSQKSFTDYNILKEEYIYLQEVPNSLRKIKSPTYKTAYKVLANQTSEYRIIIYPFSLHGKNYTIEIGQNSMVIERIKQTISIIAVFAILISLAVSLIFEIFFNRTLFKPFYEIVAQKIKNVNNPLTYNHQLISTSTEDFRALDLSIGALMDKVSSQILREKQFIANVSHELLTPISILMARLENILNNNRLDPHDSGKIYSSIKTLSRLRSVVNSLLLISKIENEQFKKPDKFPISNVIEEVILELEDRIEVKEIVLKNNIKHHFYLEGNESLIHTFFFNIINNAIKYNQQGGNITIKDKTSNEFYYVYVIDSGIGMNKENQENAFNRFEKLESEQDESHGLGLAIVKSIAQFHKIDIEILSKIGKGTTFILRFPNQYFI
jgi:signal transduction histidine kinase